MTILRGNIEVDQYAYSSGRDQYYFRSVFYYAGPLGHEDDLYVYACKKPQFDKAGLVPIKDYGGHDIYGKEHGAWIAYSKADVDKLTSTAR